MTTVFKKFATGSAVLALMTTVFATGALADDSDVTTNITGTESVVLTPIAASSFGAAVTLDGTTQTVTGAAIGTFDVTDARGTGAGWDIAVSATPFLHDTNGKSLSPGSLTLDAPVVEVNDSNSSPTTSVATLGGAIDNGAVTILSAGTDGGMGGYTISPMAMELELKPKEVYEGTYTSTVTVALTTGP